MARTYTTARATGVVDTSGSAPVKQTNIPAVAFSKVDVQRKSVAAAKRVYRPSDGWDYTAAYANASLTHRG